MTFLRCRSGGGCTHTALKRDVGKETGSYNDNSQPKERTESLGSVYPGLDLSNWFTLCRKQGALRVIPGPIYGASQSGDLVSQGGEILWWGCHMYGRKLPSRFAIFSATSISACAVEFSSSILLR